MERTSNSTQSYPTMQISSQEFDTHVRWLGNMNGLTPHELYMRRNMPKLFSYNPLALVVPLESVNNKTITRPIEVSYQQLGIEIPIAADVDKVDVVAPKTKEQNPNTFVANPMGVNVPLPAA